MIKSSKRFFTIAALTLASAATSAQISEVKLPVPNELILCEDDDPVVSAEKRVAPSVGAEYLACFTTNEKTALHGTSRTVVVPVEHAVAMSVTGGPYTREELDRLLSKVREQWKNFDPLSRQHEDYLTRLNSLIKGRSPAAHQTSIESVKPVLVSIDRMDDQSYAVVSIREYVIATDGERVRSIKANAAAMVLQGTRLVRLEIIRELHAPSDVDEVRTQIAAWSRAVAVDTAKSTRP